MPEMDRANDTERRIEQLPDGICTDQVHPHYVPVSLRIALTCRHLSLADGCYYERKASSVLGALNKVLIRSCFLASTAIAVVSPARLILRRSV